MIRFALGTFLLAVPLAAQDTPLEAFHQGIAAIQAHDRAAYLSHSLQSPALARVGPDGLRQGFDEFARGVGTTWPDTLVATHVRIVPLTADVAYGVYRYRVVDSAGSTPGVSGRIFVRTPEGGKVAVPSALPTAARAPRPLLPLLPVQRGHGGVGRGGLSLDPRAAGPARACHRRAARRVRGAAPLDDRLLAEPRRPTPVHLHGG